MSVWIMSVVGVICLGILLEIVLPEGQTAKYVKGAFSLLVVFVIAAPLPSLLGAEWSIDVSDVKFSVDEGYVSQTAILQTESVQKEVEDYLAINGYTSKVKITLKSGTVNDVARVDVKLYIGQHEELSKDEHTVKVRTLVAQRLGESEGIVFVEINSKNNSEFDDVNQ